MLWLSRDMARTYEHEECENVDPLTERAQRLSQNKTLHTLKAPKTCPFEIRSSQKDWQTIANQIPASVKYVSEGVVGKFLTYHIWFLFPSL